jgi:carbamoyl-phosphate synthase large subunit
MTTLLITAIGGDIAQAIAQIVRSVFPHWRIIGIEIHERHGGAIYVDKYIPGLPASNPTYLDWMAELIDQELIDICLPTAEAELLTLTNNGCRNIGSATLVMPPFEAIRIGMDKLATAKFVASLGLSAPWTIPTEEAHENTTFPCIFKPRRGAGSTGVFVCNSLHDVTFFRKRFPSAVLQELLLPADAEITCAVYRSRTGETFVLQLLRQLVGGSSGWVEVVSDARITHHCVVIAEALVLQGGINIQLRVTAGGPSIFEINPRFSSTALLRHHMGFTDVVWALEECQGRPITPFQPVVGTRAVRTLSAAILNKTS